MSRITWHCSMDALASRQVGNASRRSAPLPLPRPYFIPAAPPSPSIRHARWPTTSQGRLPKGQTRSGTSSFYAIWDPGNDGTSIQQRFGLFSMGGPKCGRNWKRVTVKKKFVANYRFCTKTTKAFLLKLKLYH